MAYFKVLLRLTCRRCILLCDSTYFVCCTAIGFVQCVSHLRGLVHLELHMFSTLLWIAILLMIMRLGAPQSRPERCGVVKNFYLMKSQFQEISKHSH